MSSSFPQLDSYYGVLSGAAYTIPYSIVGLLSGYLTKSKRRVLLLGLIMITISVFQSITGVTTSFGILCLMRVLHGGLSAATNPLSFSIVADYFPPEKRGTANAVLSTGNFVGIALSSLSILGIKALGWRKSYQFMAVIGVMSGFFSLLMVREPPKKPSKKDSKIKQQEIKFSDKDDSNSVSIKDKKGGFVKFLK